MIQATINILDAILSFLQHVPAFELMAFAILAVCLFMYISSRSKDYALVFITTAGFLLMYLHH